MVVVAIFLIMTAIVLGSLPSFRDKTSLDLVVKEVLTEIRQLQVYGGAARSNGVVFTPNSVLTPFGLYFDISNPKQIVLFSDTNNDKEYSGGEMIETYALGGGVQIQKICLSTPFPISTPPISDSCNDNGPVSITFTNPYPQPTLTGSLDSFSYARLFFKQTRLNETRSITISQTGQIVVTTQ